MGLRRKWLAFRALEGKSRQVTVQRPEVQAALAVTALLGVILCGLNDRPFRYSGQLAGIAQALFCIIAAGLYCAYMVISFLMSVVLSCAEERQRQLRTYDHNEYHECIELTPPNEDDDAENHDDNNDNDVIMTDDIEEDRRRPRRSRTIAPVHIGMPREIVITSMYLGGTGAFLSVGPLCMWDCAVTLAFLASLFVIAVVDVPSSRRGRLHWAVCVGMAFALAFAAAVEASSRMPQLASTTSSASSPLFFEGWWRFYTERVSLFGPSSSTQQQQAVAAIMAAGNHHNHNNNSSVAAAAIAAAAANDIVDPDQDTEAAILLTQASNPPLWPFLIFAGISPVLLRAGGGSVFVGGLYHAMSPSQTLETGLPVMMLLAGLVLSWFSPLEAALLHTRGFLRADTAIVMFVLGPGCVGSTLAFLLHGLRRRATLLSVGILLLIASLRQQVMHRRLGEHNLLDVLAVSSAALSMLGAVWLALDAFDTAASGIGSERAATNNNKKKMTSSSSYETVDRLTADEDDASSLPI